MNQPAERPDSVDSTLQEQTLQEQALPVIGPHQFVGWFFQPDPLLGWRMIPGRAAQFVKPDIHTVVQINRDGFRGEPFPETRQPGETRILLLADSFGVAIEVDQQQAFPSLLSQKLQAGGRTVQLLNAAVGGYGTEQEYLYLRDQGERLQPDIVLLAFHFGDDVIENSLALREKVHWRLVKLPRPHLAPDPEGSLRLENYPPEAGRLRKAWQRYYDYLPPAYLRQAAPAQATLSAQLARLVRRGREFLYKRRRSARQGSTVPVDARLYARQPDDDYEAAWEHSERVLRATRELSARLNARLVVAGVCTKEQVIPGYLERRLPPGGPSIAEFERFQPNRRLADILQRLELPFIDLTPPFVTAQESGQSLFYARDLHWNARGHALAAEHLMQGLQDYL